MSACFRFCTLVNRDAIMSPNQSQASQQVQRVNIFRGTELWADEVQVKRADAVHALQGLLRLMKRDFARLTAAVVAFTSAGLRLPFMSNVGCYRFSAPRNTA